MERKKKKHSILGLEEKPEKWVRKSAWSEKTAVWRGNKSAMKLRFWRKKNTNFGNDLISQRENTVKRKTNRHD